MNQRKRMIKAKYLIVKVKTWLLLSISQNAVSSIRTDSPWCQRRQRFQVPFSKQQIGPFKVLDAQTNKNIFLVPVGH